uniref:Uncharacterized protein n=1 Tax=Glossina pallidipes TaxID=7398 RepID=A0A1A9ZN12_GLOPL
MYIEKVENYLTGRAGHVLCFSREIAASADAPVYSICECHSGMHSVVSHIVAEVYKRCKKMKFDSVKMTFVTRCVAFNTVCNNIKLKQENSVSCEGNLGPLILNGLDSRPEFIRIWTRIYIEGPTMSAIGEATRCMKASEKTLMP